MQNFRALGLRSQTPIPPACRAFGLKPPTSGGWGHRSKTPIGLRRLRDPPDPKIARPPQLQISGYAPGYILLHHFNVLGYNSTSITIYCVVSMFLLLPIFCCNFLLIYLFVTAKAATASCSEEASRFRRRNVKPINKLIGSTKW